MPFRAGRHRNPRRPAPRSTVSSGTATCRASVPARNTATGCTGRTTRARHALQPGQAAARPVRQGGHRRADWNQAVFGYRFDAGGTRTTATRPHTRAMAVVINPYFDWANDRAPNIPYHESVIYEAHVRGLTMRAPGHPRGVARHVRRPRPPRDDRAPPRLGVTAVELLPVHQFVHEHNLIERGLRNYWGYNTIAYLAPHDGLRVGAVAGSQVQEFKAMVRALHEAGIEVILDVVYNHTAEGNQLGPTLSLPRHRQPRVLPSRRRRSAVLPGLHRHRQLAQRPPPAHPAADHGLVALLGDRDARRRVPVRPRRRTRPRVLRRRPAQRVLRHRAAGPGDQSRSS